MGAGLARSLLPWPGLPPTVLDCPGLSRSVSRRPALSCPPRSCPPRSCAPGSCPPRSALGRRRLRPRSERSSGPWRWSWSLLLWESGRSPVGLRRGPLLESSEPSGLPSRSLCLGAPEPCACPGCPFPAPPSETGPSLGLLSLFPDLRRLGGRRLRLGAPCPWGLESFSPPPLLSSFIGYRIHFPPGRLRPSPASTSACPRGRAEDFGCCSVCRGPPC